jgi:hypothetical protein
MERDPDASQRDLPAATSSSPPSSQGSLRGRRILLGIGVAAIVLIVAVVAYTLIVGRK